MKRFAAVAAALVLCLSLFACSGDGASAPQQDGGNAPASEQSPAAGGTGKATGVQTDAKAAEDAAKDTLKGKKVDFSAGTHHALMTIEGYGTLKIEVYSQFAPKTAREFCRLVLDGYYDGRSMYWILDDMYALIGDAAGTTKGEHVILGEYAEAGQANDLSLKRGTIAMSRGDERGTVSDASSLILFLSDISYLDGKYAAFAKVTEGMDCIDDICSRINNGSKATGIEVEKDGKIASKKDYPVIKSVRMVD